MNQQHFLPYAKQSISREDIEQVMQSLQAPIITRGPKVEEFEKAFADYCGAAYAVAFNNATSALFAACDAVKCGPQDQLLLTPNTFVATATAGVRCEATPVFVDIDRTSGNMNLAQVEQHLKQRRSRGRHIILPVHFSGIPVDMIQLDRTITDPNAIVIEDAAHALGSCYSDGQRVGCCAYSAMTIFSFHPAKTITTGEGGMVTTNNPELYHQLKLLRNVGIEKEAKHLHETPGPWYCEVQALSGNYHMTEMQAALGLSQLQRLDAFIAKRQKLVSLYREELSNLAGIRLFEGDEEKRVCPHLFVVQIDYPSRKTTRAAVMDKLHHEGIGTQVHYIPLYSHPYFKKSYGEQQEHFPEMEAYYAQALSLPLYYEMEKEDVKRVCNALRQQLS
jgi:UDP-4-amino-4,6-dideoxy-N-acetyl-beta-L-altrosamine transaminase